MEYVLSVLESVEVFLELAGLKFGGPAGRWAIIVAVQVL
jgi:Peroxisomal membrane protein (Pex16)